MERLQGPINPCSFLGEDLEAESFELGFVNNGSLRYEDAEERCFLMPSLEDNMPFLQMLQGADCPPLFPLKEPNFQTLLRLQHVRKPWEINSSFIPDMETQIQALELESCVTHEILHLNSPAKSETRDVKNQYSISCFEGVSSESIQDQPNSAMDNCWREGNSGSPPQENGPPPTQLTAYRPVAKERRKRKRTKPTKNKEEVESQRMTHIAVERNRRRQMNDHLNSLRALMHPSYIQRGDQASIIGGAIDFVKELEQLLQSLEAQKRLRSSEKSSNNSTPNSAMATISWPQCGIGSEGSENYEEEVKGSEHKSGPTKVEVNVIHNHVNLKIQCPRRPGQLLQAIITLEGLRLTVLHLNITSLQASILYSFNLKMEDDCKLRSADEVEAAIHQIFS
ncbi:hypothetical protein SLEP1_g24240 [Rubroshorea leprosula]|uniref:BHLH domain-containing protein n=1 Tax=Rubroshorea leprosula TaxID=152421 RepID=A0AAV5JF96_9ROSI|nr:hypothetical protein SLEP1_g24240 [Rubroshorea leprosula]